MLWIGVLFLMGLTDTKHWLFVPAMIAGLCASLAAALFFRVRHPWVSAVIFVMVGLAAAGVASPASMSDEEINDFVVVWCIMVGLPFGGALHYLRNPHAPHAAPGPLGRASDAPALRADEDRILERLREIAGQQKRVDAASELLRREGPAAALTPVREKLAQASQSLAKQRARHTARLWAIEVVRWQNRLSASIDGSAGTPGTRRLERLAEGVREGETLLRTLDREYAAVPTYEAERCIAQLRAVLARCAEARQALVVEEARLALRGIDPLDDEKRTAHLSAEPLETLQAELGASDSLTHAIARFDAEHERVREDDATAHDVERFLRELERGDR